LVRGRVAVRRARLDGGMRWMVAREPGGVDDHAADHPGEPEPYDRPVVAGRSPPARLPAVVLLALRAEGVLAEAGRARIHEVLLGGERLVARRHDRATEGAQGEVGQCGEAHVPLLSRRPRAPVPPRSQTLSTTPVSSRPAYGVTGWRWRRA